MLRVIAKLDVKPPFVVKPVHFEGLRKIGEPGKVAEAYYLQGADEIIYIDIVASLYQREILYNYIRAVAEKVFVPLGVGGGVKSLDDFSRLFHSGADKVVINTHALQADPNIVDEAARIFGAQSVVINIEAKRKGQGWECYSDCGRIKSGRSVTDWAKEAQDRGAGEIIIQSVDSDGRMRGFDIDLVGGLTSSLKIPVVAASGAGSMRHVLEMVKETRPAAVAIASLLHYGVCTIKELKNFLKENDVEVTE